MYVRNGAGVVDDRLSTSQSYVSGWPFLLEYSRCDDQSMSSSVRANASVDRRCMRSFVGFAALSRSLGENQEKGC
jgi:hypothetical protein